MSTVSGRVARALGLESFADLAPGVGVTAIARDGVTFDGALSPEQASAIYDRMTSRNDVDQAQRAVIRDARDAVEAGPTLENVAALSLLTANYSLGESS